MSFHRIVTTEAERINELRTDERFRNQFQREHHNGQSILECLPIDMVKQFVVSDSLHLFDLGLMKRYPYRYIQLYFYCFYLPVFFKRLSGDEKLTSLNIQAACSKHICYCNND